MAEKGKETEKVVDLQRRLDEIRQEAESKGLTIVIAWDHPKGGFETVSLKTTDSIKIGIMQ